jgi:hypothetical protein
MMGWLPAYMEVTCSCFFNSTRHYKREIPHAIPIGYHKFVTATKIPMQSSTGLYCWRADQFQVEDTDLVNIDSLEEEGRILSGKKAKLVGEMLWDFKKRDSHNKKMAAKRISRELPRKEKRGERKGTFSGGNPSMSIAHQSTPINAAPYGHISSTPTILPTSTPVPFSPPSAANSTNTTISLLENGDRRMEINSRDPNVTREVDVEHVVLGDQPMMPRLLAQT